MFQFRPYKEKDYEELKQMVNALYTEDSGGEKMTDSKLLNTIAHFNRYPNKGDIIIAENQFNPLGYAVIVNHWSNENECDIMHIDEFFIKERYRGIGLGSLFLKYLKDVAGKEKKILQLEVMPSNYKAMVFYAGLGFKMSDKKLMSTENN